MTQAGILDNLRSYMAEEMLDGQDIGLDASTPLLEWGVINSIEIARLVAFIRNEYDVDVPPDKIVIEHFKDLASMTALVAGLLPDETGPGATL